MLTFFRYNFTIYQKEGFDMFRNNTPIFLSIILILSINPMNGMDLTELFGNVGSMSIGRVTVGNRVVISNGRVVYADGVTYSNTSDISTWRCETNETQGFAIENNDTISVTNSLGNIAIEGHDAEHAKLIISKLAKTEADLERVTSIISNTQGSLEVTTKYAQEAAQALINYRLLLPRAMQFCYQLNNDSGNISVEKIQGNIASASSESGKITVKNISGSVSAKTASGDIAIFDIGGSFNANVASGDITAQNVEGSVNVNAASGDITCSNVGMFNGNAASGDITVYADALRGSVSAATASGDIKIYAKALHARLQASSFTGKITTDFPAQQSGSSYIIGNGGTMISLNSCSGDIRLKKN